MRREAPVRDLPKPVARGPIVSMSSTACEVRVEPAPSELNSTWNGGHSIAASLTVGRLCQCLAGEDVENGWFPAVTALLATLPHERWTQ